MKNEGVNKGDKDRTEEGDRVILRQKYRENVQNYDSCFTMNKQTTKCKESPM